MLMTTNVEKSLDLAIGGTYEHVRPEDFKRISENVADAVGWPSNEPDEFYYPERGTSND
jgi:hypothetical protein